MAHSVSANIFEDSPDQHEGEDGKLSKDFYKSEEDVAKDFAEHRCPDYVGSVKDLNHEDDGYLSKSKSLESVY